MKILLTGSTGYIGRRLLPELVQEGHEVVCCVRDKKNRVPKEKKFGRIRLLRFLKLIF